MWIDESGFSLLPAVVRTYAPRGQTPILRVPWTREHWSVIGAVTLDEQLFLMVEPHALKSADVIRFLQDLLAQVPGKLLVIWDGAPIHRSREVQQFLAQQAKERIQVEQLPGYAPELNPGEGVWNYLKRVELKNQCCQTLAHLREELDRATARLRDQQHILRACIQHAGYHV